MRETNPDYFPHIPVAFTLQEAGAGALIALAVAYLVWRIRRRRLSENCCGEKECPAAKDMLRDLDR